MLLHIYQNTTHRKLEADIPDTQCLAVIIWVSERREPPHRNLHELYFFCCICTIHGYLFLGASLPVFREAKTIKVDSNFHVKSIFWPMMLV